MEYESIEDLIKCQEGLTGTPVEKPACMVVGGERVKGLIWGSLGFVKDALGKMALSYMTDHGQGPSLLPQPNPSDPNQQFFLCGWIVAPPFPQASLPPDYCLLSIYHPSPLSLYIPTLIMCLLYLTVSYVREGPESSC